MTRVRRVLAWPLIAVVRAYQLLISPLLPPSCRFYPSCSAYAVTALERFGPLRGTWLAMRRLGRCHPWTAGGVDHVPARPGEVLDHLGRSVPTGSGPHGIPENAGPIEDGDATSAMAVPHTPHHTTDPARGRGPNRRT